MTRISVTEPLIAALLSYPGVDSVSDIRDRPEQWVVSVVFERSLRGWLALEWLSWAINHDWRQGHTVVFEPTAAYPLLNENSLSFMLAGNADALALALFLSEQVEDYLTTLEGGD